ncbi:ABC transporter substrate-binding protein [Paenibacillus cremeus]|uniref:Sugar ABC transporter substrate-binding protein n=1 Tax=Paenibacillus cremeus TaxID=2163881 RepID=A0A559K337_9BACL|nr:sugar ABC transporter substrate-binding protein [Paenibacillus cremeus]TVY06542.1 sugar ABC transporter substrate-binding protein [Paenibacillus cremeus]
MKNALKGMTVLTVSGAILISGCSSSPDSPAAQPKSDTAAPAKSNEPITLRIISPTVVEKPEGDAEKKFADDYMAKHPNIKIEFVGVPMNDVYAKIMTMATGGDMPDIFVNGPEFYAKAYDMGLTEDLNKLLGSDFVKGFHPATLKESVLDNKLQYAPWFTIPTGLLYRKDWFEKEGIKPPDTWDDFIEAAKKLTQDTDKDGKVDRWGFAMVGAKNGSGGSRFIPIMRTFGAAELVQNDKKEWTTQFASPEAVQAFQFYGDLVNKYQVVPPGPFQTSYAEAVSLMASEKTAMMVTGPHSIGAILKQNPGLEGKIAGIPLPHAPGKQSVSVLGMLGFSVSAKSKHKQEAADYLKYLLEKQNQLEWNKVTGRFPTRLDASNDPQIKSPVLEGFLKAMDTAFQVPNVPYYTNLQVVAAEGYQAVIAKQATAEEAAKKAAAATETEIKNNK